MSEIVYFLYILAKKSYELKIPLVTWLIKVFIRVVFNCFLPYTAKIGKNCLIAFGGLGSIVNEDFFVGENCYIGSGVTLGVTALKEGTSNIENRVYLGTGAKLLGPIKIGDNSVIGANAVVLKDVPPNVMVAGVPAKIIKENIDISKYHTT